MQQISTVLDNMLKSQHGNQLGISSQPSTPDRPSLKSKQQLAEILSRTCALQKAYGKTEAELETLVDGFSWALVGYDISHIRQAFRQYIVTNSDIPSPADIIKIVKEIKSSDGVDMPTIEQLRQYRDKGIPLTAKQQDLLSQSEAKHAEPARNPSLEWIHE